MLTAVIENRLHTKIRKEFQGRRLIVVDIENIIGGPVDCLQVVEEAKALVEEFATPNEKDHIVIGTSHQTAQLNTKIVWQSPRVVFSQGHDGAELALTDILDTENIPSRFEEVLIFSGDHFFAPHVAELGRNFVNVHVFSQRSKLSRTLKMAAKEVTYLPEEIQLGEAA